MSNAENDTMQTRSLPNAAIRTTATLRGESAVLLPESILIALAFGGACWLFDAFLTTSLAGTPIARSLLPSGDALALRSVVSLLVAISAGITSTFLIREFRLRKQDDEQPEQSSAELLESFSECAFAVHADGEIIDANQAAARLFSWPVNMFMPMKIDWLISEYVQDERHIRSFADLAGDDPDCCNSGSILVICKALTGKKFVAELSCMQAMEQDRRYIVFLRERTETPAPQVQKPE